MSIVTLTEEQRQESRAFYREALELLHETGTKWMLGGAFAMFHYTGIYRDTKDLDVFCKASDATKIMRFFKDKGYRVENYDVRWLAKIHKDPYFIDLIFDTVNNICRVDDTWYERAPETTFCDVPVRMIPAEELTWCKLYVQNRERYDGADINHVWLKAGKNMDWNHVLFRMEQHWHILLQHIISFQFCYPSEFHEIIPRWLFDELIRRAQEQYELPAAMEKVCRGPIIDQTQYAIDIKDWDYKVTTIKTV